MSGVTEPCPDCGKPVTVMCGSIPGRCYECYQKANPIVAYVTIPMMTKALKQGTISSLPREDA